MKTWQKLTVGASAVVLVLAAGTGIATATIPDSGGVIHGCYKPNANGSIAPLNVIDTSLSGGTCPANQTALTWSQTGPQGPAGPPGASTAGSAGLDTLFVRVLATGNATATCPADHPYVLGGGGDAALHATPVKFSAPIVGGLEPSSGSESANPPGGWFVGLVDQSATAIAWAICAK